MYDKIITEISSEPKGEYKVVRTLSDWTYYEKIKNEEDTTNLYYSGYVDIYVDTILAVRLNLEFSIYAGYEGQENMYTHGSIRLKSVVFYNDKIKRLFIGRIKVNYDYYDGCCMMVNNNIKQNKTCGLTVISFLDEIRELPPINTDYKIEFKCTYSSGGVTYLYNKIGVGDKFSYYAEYR